MDLKMQSYVNSDKERIWDFCINEEQGNLIIMPDEHTEEYQRAVVASFTQRGSIPQLPDIGVQWAEFLTESVGANEVSSQIIKAIQENAGSFAFLPTYSKQNGKLVVTIKEVGK